MHNQKKEGKKIGRVIEFLKIIVSPANFFRYKKFYLLLLTDVFFLLLLMGMGALLERYQDTDITKAFILSILSLVFIIISFTTLKYLFFHMINQDRNYGTILWKYTLGFMSIFVINYILFQIIYTIIANGIVADKVETVKLVTRDIFLVVTYIAFLFFHKFSHSSFFKAVGRCFKSALGLIFYVLRVIFDIIILCLISPIYIPSLFIKAILLLFKINLLSFKLLDSISNYIWKEFKLIIHESPYKFLYHDLFIFIVGYFIFQIFVLAFQYLMVYPKVELGILNFLFTNIEFIYGFILLTVILTINKLVAYEVDMEKIK